jgi:diphthine methyl ester acylhydrolase
MSRNEYRTIFHCCSIESLPNSSNNEFLCGLYELNEEESCRKGGVAICNENEILECYEISHGILDMKFLNNHLLACALSNGDILLYRYENQALSQFHICENGRSEGLALSVSWNHSTINSKLAVSTQNGSLLFYSVTPSGLLEETTISNAHDLFGEVVPAWIVAMAPHHEDVLLSGGDDCCMKLWDLRMNSSSAIYTSSKHYTAGVTSAQWHPTDRNIFAVGSYDATIKIWDYRSYRQPLCEVDTGGGVWRIKWATSKSRTWDHPSDLLAVASMQGGSGIYRWENSTQVIETLDQQVDSNPNRLVYGIDWLFCETSEAEEGEAKGAKTQCHWKIATCSFYDNLVQIWNGITTTGPTMRMPSKGCH